MNLDIVLESECEAMDMPWKIGYRYGDVRLGATDPPGKCFTVVVTAISGTSIRKRVIWFYIAIVNALDLGTVLRLLAWIWAIFGAVFGSISITIPTSKYEKFVFDSVTNMYFQKLAGLGERNQFCICTLRDIAREDGADSEVYEHLADVFKGVGIDDGGLPLCEYDFSMRYLRSGEVNNWKTVSALIAAIIFYGIKTIYCSDEYFQLSTTTRCLDGIGVNSWMDAANSFDAAYFRSIFQQSRFCIDTIGLVPPQEVFDGDYVMINSYTFGDTAYNLYVYAGKREDGQEIVFYTPKYRFREIDWHCRKDFFQ
jgi:hypothetical protein